MYYFAQTLFKSFPPGQLFVIGSSKLPNYQREEWAEIFRFQSEEPNFLKRSQEFSQWLTQKVSRDHAWKLFHFRDPWSGLALIELSGTLPNKPKLVYEVNGLPSIELPYRYPWVSEKTLEKIRGREKICMQAADLLVCPSGVIRDYLVKDGIPSQKIQVIPNGAEIPSLPPGPRLGPPSPYILYFGALQAWQGIEETLRSLKYLQDFPELKLVICSSNREKYARPFRRLAEKLEVSSQIQWYFELPKKELYALLSQAHLSLAPLQACRRNLEQGCSPLKILESMALATPVLASDLPAVREILPDPDMALFARPGRPADLARQIRLSLEYPEQIQEMGLRAQKHLIQHFTWKKQCDLLRASYEELIS